MSRTALHIHDLLRTHPRHPIHFIPPLQYPRTSLQCVLVAFSSGALQLHNRLIAHLSHIFTNSGERNVHSPLSWLSRMYSLVSWVRFPSEEGIEPAGNVQKGNSKHSCEASKVGTPYCTMRRRRALHEVHITTIRMRVCVETCTYTCRRDAP